MKRLGSGSYSNLRTVLARWRQREAMTLMGSLWNLLRARTTAKAMCSLFLLSGCGEGRPYLQTLELNREGNKALTAQSYSPAMEKYLSALRYDPFVGQLHLNLGLSFEGLQQADKALQSYQEAERLALAQKDMALVFMARFNQAQLLGKAKQVDQALAVYQKALEVIPTSKEVKTNIELLTQQQQGQGGGDGQQNQPQSGDQQQQNQNQQGQDPKEGDQNKDQDQDPKEDKKPQQSQKYKPRQFQGKELSEGDVKKILGELKQQEERIRAEYNRKDVKEQPRDKDW